MISATMKAFIKKKETLRLKAYRDQGKKGIWTIGYGHTGPEVVEGLVWTEAQADVAFERDCLDHELQTRKLLKVDPTQEQIDALTSLVFNIGSGNFQTSTVRKQHNAGNFAAAGAAFGMWNKITDPDTKEKRISEGLTARRAYEASVYLTEREAHPHTTSAIPLAAKDPAAASSFNPANIATAVGTTATTAAATVSTVSSAWDSISDVIDPRYLVWALAIGAVCTLAYFVYDKIQRNKEGDR